MALKPEVSLPASLATMGLVYGIYQLQLPNLADTRAAAPHNSTVESSRKAFVWTAVSACAALSLMTKEPNIFIFGGGMAVALDVFTRHANAVHPGTGQVTMPPASGPTPGGVSAGS
jgi:hypothetical protein